MRRLGEEKQRQFAQQFIGATLEVIPEAGEQDGLMRAVADNYLSVHLPANKQQTGKRQRVRINTYGPKGLEGEPQLSRNG